MILIDKEKPIDVLMVAEGTYPFIRGGVSTWIHDLITGLDEFNFGVIFLGSNEDDYQGIRYELPENLVYLDSHYLFSNSERPQPEILDGSRNLLREINGLHKWFKLHAGQAFPEYARHLKFFLETVTERDFLYSRKSWKFIEESYFNFASNLPFIDYFWTVRNIHGPIWRVAKIAQSLPYIKVVHSPSTGYAGFLSSIIRYDRKIPFILTEHGIYTRERKIDIVNADWIQDKRFFFQREKGNIDHIKNMWINFFLGIGKVSYDAADLIVSLFNNARDIQIGLGAPKEKTKIIPNGVKIKNYASARKPANRETPHVVALIGRVVPIKDVKTFIKAMRLVKSKIPDIEGWVVGPTDEDPNYFKECKQLVSILGLNDTIRFLGFQKLTDIFPKIGLTTLTSISEGMPLVVLESFAAGVPCVTTDVGSCRQLIYGGINDDDKSLGKAGEVVPVANPSALAESYKRFLWDKKLYKNASGVAINRVEKFYTFESFLDNYRKIYKRAIDGRHLV